MILGLFLITFLGGCSSKAKLQQLPTSEDMQLHIDLQNGKYDIDLDSEENKDKKAILRNNDQEDDDDDACSDDETEECDECDECDCDTCATSKNDSCCEQTCDNCNAPKESVMYVPYPYPVFVPNNIGWQDFKLPINPNENSTEAPLTSHNCPAGVARCTSRNHRSLSLREQKNIENYAKNDEIPDKGYRRGNYRAVDETFHPDSAMEILPTRRVDQSVFSRKELQSDFDLEEAKRQIEMLQREYAKLDQNESYQQKPTSFRDESNHPQPNREIPYRRKELEEYYEHVPKHQQNYKDDPNYPIPYHDVPIHQRSYQEQSTHEDVPTHKKYYQEQSAYEEVPNNKNSYQERSIYQDLPNRENSHQVQNPYQDVPSHRKFYQDQSNYQDLTNHQKTYQDKSTYQDVPNHDTPYQGQQSTYEDVPINQKTYQNKHSYQDVPNHQKSYQDQRPSQDIPTTHFHQESDSDTRRFQTTNKNAGCNEQHPHIPDHEKQDAHNQPQYKYEATHDQPYQSVNELLKALTGRRRK